MATPGELATEGALTDLSSALEKHVLPERCMYAFPRFVDWYGNDLPGLHCDYRGGGRMSPLDQVDDLLERFLTGGSFDVEWKSRGLHPQEKGIWELKTSDTRLFGWFWRPNNFILYRGADATWTKDAGAYRGFILETEYHRDQLDLDQPKFTPGGYNDVFRL